MRRSLVLIAALVPLVPAMRTRAPHATLPPTVERTTVTMHARGTFDVKVLPQTGDNAAEQGGIGRWMLDKQIQGDLSGTSLGVMLAAGEPASGSGGYVAIEKVTGTLNGKRGSFALMHNGTMVKGASTMHVTVVPGSGTDELAGISGTFEIIIEGKVHRYDFEYSVGT